MATTGQDSSSSPTWWRKATGGKKRECYRSVFYPGIFVCLFVCLFVVTLAFTWKTRHTYVTGSGKRDIFMHTFKIELLAPLGRVSSQL